ncbi:MAG TPA: WecB/TagA/CpsF family glycosyltransferase [Rectinemataceae bacterium]
MDHIEIETRVLGGLRLDFPAERHIGALAMAWDDGKNHQVAFVGPQDLRAALARGEYGSMLASADLVLTSSPSLARQAAETGSAGQVRRIPVPRHREAYAALFEGSGEDEEASGGLVSAYRPLHVLSLILSALETRSGTLFLVGGSVSCLQAAEGNLKSTFPGIRIVGRSRGDYPSQGEEGVMKAIQKASPDLVLVGSLVEGGELWIPRHMRFTKSGIFLYEGSIIEVLAGRA